MMSIETLLLFVVLIVGFYMLWNLGANDVANAIGTSVGSKALSLRNAVIIAALLEFFGAFTLGSNVSETIQSGIITPSVFEGDAMVFILGMIGALLATALWLQIATFFRWPVSTTHAIIGAILGFGVVVGGVRSVHWEMVGAIALSWIISPLLSGFISYLFFIYIQRLILYSPSPGARTVKFAPYLLGITLFTMLANSGVNGIQHFSLDLSFRWVLGGSFVLSVLSVCISKLLLRWIPVKVDGSTHTSEMTHTQLHSLYKAKMHLSHFKARTSDPYVVEIEGMMQQIRKILHSLKSSVQTSSISAEYQLVEKIFSYLQIVTACFVAFAHGANDVANAVGPVAAVVQIIHNPQTFNEHSVIPLWLLALGGVGIVIGLATYGWRVIETVGHKITSLTPTRGFCAEFGAATSIILASKLGFPISTTQCIVGAVLGVGLARGIAALNTRVLRDIFISWVVTLPSSALLSVSLYFILHAIFGSYSLV